MHALQSESPTENSFAAEGSHCRECTKPSVHKRSAVLDHLVRSLPHDGGCIHIRARSGAQVRSIRESPLIFACCFEHKFSAGRTRSLEGVAFDGDCYIHTRHRPFVGMHVDLCSAGVGMHVLRHGVPMLLGDPQGSPIIKVTTSC
jgi:hypothetical protein